MGDYHFVSRWRVQAPIEAVWEELVHSERWPSWWRDVRAVQELAPGDADGVGEVRRLQFATRLPYRLGFDVRVSRVERPTLLEADASGELEGVGRWRLRPDDGGTLVRYEWDVRTTRWWMNLLAPLARPLFAWNHDALMRAAAAGLARRLDAELELPDARARRARPAAVALVALVAALVALGLARRRRRAGAALSGPRR